MLLLNRRAAVVLVATVLAAAGCSRSSPRAAVSTPTTVTATSAVPPTSTTAPATPQTAPSTTAPAFAKRWRLSTYYTAVESFHHGSLVTVKGCTIRDCAFGSDDLGRYPKDFVQAVEDEGTGRITSGAHAGQYLNWSYDVGYWLDTIPSDTDGYPLVPWETSAADGLATGTRFAVTDCGNQEGDPLDPTTCARFKATTWVVRDAFTPGLGGEQHADLYVGEEDRPHFTSDEGSPYVDMSGARITAR